MEGLMDDKIVTHEDLAAARALVEAADRHGTEASRELARSILAAVEADQPPLPEGWVAFYDLGRHAFRHLWHDGRGSLYTHDEPMAQFLVGKVGDDRYPRDLLTPLRPAVVDQAAVTRGMTEVAVSKARLTQDEAQALVVKILSVAGIEVSDR